ncbi:MAG: CPBP family intramembrane metalloprotease [Myxococcales bacterium]|nr:CPBP family intramembrane metalloprotease [Myxococcales bacterium]
MDNQKDSSSPAGGQAPAEAGGQAPTGEQAPGGEPTAQAPDARVENHPQRKGLFDEWRVIRSLGSDLGLAPALLAVVATFLIIVFHENGSSSFFSIYFAKFFKKTSFSGLYPAFYWYGMCFLLLGVIPFVLMKTAFRRSSPESGAGLGDWKFGLPASLTAYFAFLPILVLVSYLPEFRSKYPLFSDAGQSGFHLLAYEASYAVYFIGWEYVFRGFLLFGLLRRLGSFAVLLQMIPFAILHFGKPELETISAIVAGILLGFLALRARSFWYGWLLHSLVAITNDLLILWHRGG